MLSLLQVNLVGVAASCPHFIRFRRREKDSGKTSLMLRLGYATRVVPFFLDWIESLCLLFADESFWQ